MKSDIMTRDGEIPAIFNPKRVRAPSVVVTGDSPNGPYGSFTNIINASNPQINQPDPTTTGSNNQPDGCENVGSSITAPNIQTTTVISNNSENPGNSENPSTNAEVPPRVSIHRRRLKACEESCCSELAQKV